MKSDDELRKYRTYGGLTMLQFLGLLMVAGLAGQALLKWLF